MNKIFLAYLTIASIMVGVTLGLLLGSTILSPPPSTTISETCNTLISNGPPTEKITITFIADEQKTKELTETLFSIEPYRSNKESFNIYYLTPEEYTPICELYEGIATFCYTQELLRQTSACPNDFIIATREEETNIRSSSYLNVISLNTNNLVNVLPHEFAHVLANLADEYVPAEIPKKSENCALTCENFNGLDEGCYLGCSDNEHYRSIESGLMKTLTSDNFGNFDESIIQQKINLLLEKKNKKTLSFTGRAVQEEQTSCKEEYYLQQPASITQGIITLEGEPTIIQGCRSTSSTEGITLQLQDETQQTLWEEQLNPQTIITETQGTEQLEGTHQPYEGRFYLQLPLITKTKTLLLLDEEGNIITKKDLDLTKELILLGEMNNAQTCTQ